MNCSAVGVPWLSEGGCFILTYFYLLDITYVKTLWIGKVVI